MSPRNGQGGCREGIFPETRGAQTQWIVGGRRGRIGRRHRERIATGGTLEGFTGQLRSGLEPLPAATADDQRMRLGCRCGGGLRCRWR